MASQRFNASDLGVTLGRTTTTPATIAGLVAGLRESLAKWDTLASSPRDDGGEITATARTVARYASILVDDHNADADAVRDLVVSRFAGFDTDADAIAAIIPADDADATDADADATPTA